LSQSNFGSGNQPSALKMRRALSLLRERAPWLEVDGEMRGGLALDGRQRSQTMPRSSLTANANLLVLPNLDAANIAHNLLKALAQRAAGTRRVLRNSSKLSPRIRA